jgi:hypothetical protein
VASANLGVRGGFSDDVVEEDPADDDREGATPRAAGRLLSSEELMAMCYRKDGEARKR